MSTVGYVVRMDQDAQAAMTYSILIVMEIVNVSKSEATLLNDCRFCLDLQSNHILSVTACVDACKTCTNSFTCSECLATFFKQYDTLCSARKI